jgi:hypothetical protein
MMVGTSISNEVDGIRAPTMWLTHLIHHRMAANRPSINRIGLPGAERSKLVAGQANLNHTMRAARFLLGKSQVRRPSGANRLHLKLIRATLFGLKGLHMRNLG